MNRSRLQSLINTEPCDSSSALTHCLTGHFHWSRLHPMASEVRPQVTNCFRTSDKHQLFWNCAELWIIAVWRWGENLILTYLVELWWFYWSDGIQMMLLELHSVFISAHYTFSLNTHYRRYDCFVQPLTNKSWTSRLWFAQQPDATHSFVFPVWFFIFLVVCSEGSSASSCQSCLPTADTNIVIPLNSLSHSGSPHANHIRSPAA